MKIFSPFNLLICLLLPILGVGQSKTLTAQLASKRVTLPNSWKLSPHGKSVSLGDLPLNLVVSPNKSYMVATNNGQSVQSLQLFNVKKGEIVDSKVIPKSWYGLKIAADNKTIYASGGNDNVILHFEIVEDKLVDKGKISLSNIPKDNISPAGLDLDDATGILYVVTNCLLYTSPSPRDRQKSRMPSSA